MKISNIALDIVELLLNERKECYLREIAKKTNNSTSSISRQLKILRDNKIINEKRLGKELLYSLNFQNNTALKFCELTETQKLEKFYKKYYEIKIILKDFLTQIRNEHLANATVFGSVAKEEFGKQSDIDILIITDKKQDYAPVIRKIYAEYGMDLSIVNLVKKDLLEKKHEPLIKQIIKNHLIIFGYEYLIREVIAYE